MINAVFYFCIFVSVVGSAEGSIASMKQSFRQAIASNHVIMETFLLEDSQVDPNRHCDWILMRDMNNEGKAFCQDKERLHNCYGVRHFSRLQGNWTIGQVLHDSQPPASPLLWSQKPKLHICQELCEFHVSRWGTPAHLWNYMDESFVG